MAGGSRGTTGKLASHDSFAGTREYRPPRAWYINTRLEGDFELGPNQRLRGDHRSIICDKLT